MKKPSPYHFPELWFTPSRPAQIFHLLLIVVTVSVGSVAAVIYSLGYKVNWQTGSVQQTGLISLGTDQRSLPATVRIGNEQVSTTVAYRSRPLFPGDYQVEVSRPGYNTWIRTVQVRANRVSGFPKVLLLLEKPTLQNATTAEISRIYSHRPDRSGIVVRDNELWLDGELVTRLSEDIVDATWYPGRSHVLYQTKSGLWLLEREGRFTQDVLRFDAVDPETGETDVASWSFFDAGMKLVVEAPFLEKAQTLTLW